MKERILEIISAKKLTKTEFAKRLNVSQAFVSQLCAGAREPSDRTISDICEKFGINEIWLRTGVGEMKLPLSQNEQLAKIFADVQVSDDERARLVKAFASLPPEAYPQIYKWFQAFTANLNP
nr:MAG TPA: helix-turn-helix domain protein [Caudoviricetes sp.]